MEGTRFFGRAVASVLGRGQGGEAGIKTAATIAPHAPVEQATPLEQFVPEQALYEAASRAVGYGPAGQPGPIVSLGDGLGIQAVPARPSGVLPTDALGQVDDSIRGTFNLWTNLPDERGLSTAGAKRYELVGAQPSESVQWEFGFGGGVSLPNFRVTG